MSISYNFIYRQVCIDTRNNFSAIKCNKAEDKRKARFDIIECLVVLS